MNDSREYILLISLHLFMQKDFKNVTLKNIVDTTGLSKGAFYHYFSSKEQVFREVINHFFLTVMTENFDSYSRDSLKEFYNDILAKHDKNKALSAEFTLNEKVNISNNNYFYLIFDAMRILPDFKERHNEQQIEELRAWKEISGVAKKNREINTSMTDEQVAKAFIYLGDGININLVLNSSIISGEHELRVLWDGLYNSLKT